MFLILFAGLLGGSIAFAVLLAHFGFFVALLGAHFISSFAAFAAGVFLAFRRSEASRRFSPAARIA